MRVRILAVGTRMPEWVTTAYEDYTRRMRKDMRVDLEEIPVGRVKADEEKHLESLDRQQQGILFDLDYASHEVEFHGKMLRLWDEKLIPQAQNEELKRLLADVRSAVERHLEEAKKLKASLGRKK